MAERRPQEVADDAVVLWRDSRRAQFWALFFMALWMVLYLGGAMSLWVIAGGLIATTAILIAVIVIFKPRQAAAWVEASHITTPRWFMPARRWALAEPVSISQTGDPERWLCQFKPEGRRQRDIIVWRDDEALERLRQLNVKLPEALD